MVAGHHADSLPNSPGCPFWKEQLAALACLVSLSTVGHGMQNGKIAPWFSAINKKKHSHSVFVSYPKHYRVFILHSLTLLKKQ